MTLDPLPTFYPTWVDYDSVLDPKLFIPDPDPASNVPSSGSGSNLY